MSEMGGKQQVEIASVVSRAGFLGSWVTCKQEPRRCGWKKAGMGKSKVIQGEVRRGKVRQGTPG